MIVLDLGHGRTKPGFVVGDLLEKDLNLSTGLLIFEALKEKAPHIQVLLTRDDDIDVPPLSARIFLINQLQASYDEPVRFVASIHFNGFEMASAKGVEAIVYEGNIEMYRLGQRVASAVSPIVNGLRGDQGVWTMQQLGRRLGILEKTTVNSIVIEGGFMTNPKDRALMVRESWRRDFADRLADVFIEQYSKVGV